MKYNLINPQNTDAAYRLTFNGGWSYSKSGLIGNGTNTFANPHFFSNKGVITGGSFPIGFNGFGVHILDKPNLTFGGIMGTDVSFDRNNNHFMEGPGIAGVTSSVAINFYPGYTPLGDKGINQTNKRFAQHMASMKTDTTTNGNVYMWWSSNNGTQSNSSGPHTVNSDSFYGNNLPIQIGRSRPSPIYGNYTYNCFYIASGQNALNTFGLTFSIMTTITQIMNTFAADLGR
jgi:hypothetical protein